MTGVDSQSSFKKCKYNVFLIHIITVQMQMRLVKGTRTCKLKTLSSTERGVSESILPGNIKTYPECGMFYKKIGLDSLQSQCRKNIKQNTMCQSLMGSWFLKSYKSHFGDIWGDLNSNWIFDTRKLLISLGVIMVSSFCRRTSLFLGDTCWTMSGWSVLRVMSATYSQIILRKSL